MLALANVAVAALQFYEPVLFGKVVDLLSTAPRQAGRRAVERGARAAGAVGGGGHWRHRGQHRRLPAGRPHGPPPAARRHGDLLRARAGAALRLPSRPAFRPAAQGHADRRRPPVRHLAVVLPREPRDLRRPVHHAAAQPVHELAARPAADRADPVLRRRQRLGGEPHRPPAAAGRGPPQRARQPGERCAGQHPPDPELRAAGRRKPARCIASSARPWRRSIRC